MLSSKLVSSLQSSSPSSAISPSQSLSLLPEVLTMFLVLPPTTRIGCGEMRYYALQDAGYFDNDDDDDDKSCFEPLQASKLR